MTLKKYAALSLFVLTTVWVYPTLAIDAVEDFLSTQASLKQNSKQKNIIFHILTANIAADRQHPEEALTHYMEAVHLADDPAIAQMATEYAISVQAMPEALEASQLWADKATNDIKAQIIAATLLISVAPEKMVPYIKRAIFLDPEEANEHLLVIQLKISPEARQKINQSLLDLANQMPKNKDIIYAAANSTAYLKEFDKAAQLVDKILALDAEYTNAIKLKAKLIRYQKESDMPALDYLQTQVKRYPKNADLRLFLAKALLDINLIEKARPHLLKVSKDKQFGTEGAIILGEIYLAEQNYTTAKKYLLQAAKHQEQQSLAHFLLGQAEEYQNHLDLAIEWYLKVTQDAYHIPAYLRASSILIEQKKYAKAKKILNDANPETFAEQKQVLLKEIDILIETRELEEALDKSSHALSIVPSDIDFLYARSLAASLTNDISLAEKDLQFILTIEPDHADALNALGYALSTQPNRLNDAMKYIQQALKISPNNPIFMDSMGWVLYRMGKYEDSIHFLKRAYHLSKDSDIAAHFGEVLWISGQPSQAKVIWQEALKESPNDDAILETMKRLENKKAAPIAAKVKLTP